MASAFYGIQTFFKGRASIHILLLSDNMTVVPDINHLGEPGQRSWSNEQHWSAEPSAQARCVWFCSCLCKVWSHVLEALLLALRTLSPFRHYNSSSNSKTFLRSLRSQAPQQQYTVLSLSSMWRHGHSHKLTSSRALRYYTVGIPFQMHRPNLQYCTVGIPFWTSHKRQSQMSKFNGKTTIPARSNSHDHTLPLRTCYGEVYGNIAREENGWLSGLVVSL